MEQTPPTAATWPPYAQPTAHPAPAVAPPSPAAPQAQAATSPAHLEAIGDRIPVNWEGVTLLLPPSVEQWDLDALEAFETGKAVSALRLILGTKQYDEARAAFTVTTGRKATVGDLNGLVEAIAQVYGFDNPGE